MSKMKEIFIRACDDISLKKYGKDFYDLSKEEQDTVCKEAEQASISYYSNLIDTERERKKYG